MPDQKANSFAHATDQLLHGGALMPAAELSDDLALAARLRDTAPAAMPDPAFVAALRAELLAQHATRMRPSATLRCAPLEAPFGRFFIAHRNGKVVSAHSARDAETFAREVALSVGERPSIEAALPEQLQQAVLEHLEGRRRFTDVDLSWLKPFHRRVLEKTAEIPRGEVRPYAWVAREIGAPGATRAVGTALGHNPIPFIIPCHRVVRSDGSLGEYSGGGPEVKVRVLTYEGVPGELIQPRAGHGPRYRASRTTNIFCYPTCHNARGIAPEHAVEFKSPAAAVAAGYQACRQCRPG